MSPRVHNMLRVRVCAAHMGGFLGPKFSKQGSLFRQIFLKQGWVIQKLPKNSKNGWFSAKIHHKSGYDRKFRFLEEGTFLKTGRQTPVHPQVMYPPPGDEPLFLLEKVGFLEKNLVYLMSPSLLVRETWFI